LGGMTHGGVNSDDVIWMNSFLAIQVLAAEASSSRP